MTLSFLFNKIFIAIFAGFLLGRIFYILDTYNTLFVNPLVFFNYFKYQGFSLFGAFLGSILAMTYLIKDKKTLGRVLDITAISFYPYLFLYFMSKPFTLWHFVIQSGPIIIAISLFILFNYLHKNYSLQDSSIFYIISIILAHINLLYNIFNYHKYIVFYFAFSDLLSVMLIIIAIVLLFKNESKLFLKLNK